MKNWENLKALFAALNEETEYLEMCIRDRFVHCICEWLGKRKLKLLAVPRKMNWKFGLVIFLLSALILGIYYLAYYPGGIIIDSFNQWYHCLLYTSRCV